jgi:hypothetical protein
VAGVPLVGKTQVVVVLAREANMVSQVRLMGVLERRMIAAKRRSDSTREGKLKAMLHKLQQGDRPGLLLLELQSIHKVSRDIGGLILPGKGRTPWIVPVAAPKRPESNKLRGGL